MRVGKASISSIFLDINKAYPSKPYVVKVSSKPYPTGYITLQFQMFDDRTSNTRKHIVYFLGYMELMIMTQTY